MSQLQKTLEEQKLAATEKEEAIQQVSETAEDATAAREQLEAQLSRQEEALKKSEERCQAIQQEFDETRMTSLGAEDESQELIADLNMRLEQAQVDYEAMTMKMEETSVSARSPVVSDLSSAPSRLDRNGRPFRFDCSNRRSFMTTNESSVASENWNYSSRRKRSRI